MDLDQQIDIAMTVADHFEIAFTVARGLDQAKTFAQTAIADVREQHPEISEQALMLAVGWALGRLEMRQRLAMDAG